MFYGTQTWNPVLIVAQILAIQSLFYITFGLALWVLVGPYTSGKLMLGHFFGTQWINFRSFIGWMEILATVGNAFPTSICILSVVERAKKCLDFAATVFILHLGIACMVAGFPKTAAWWISNVVAFMITAVGSEWLCLRREMKDIPIGGSGGRRASGALGGAELVPLDTAGSLSKSATGLSRSSQTENSLLGRIKASMGSSRLKSPHRDPIRLVEEV